MNTIINQTESFILNSPFRTTLETPMETESDFFQKLEHYRELVLSYEISNSIFDFICDDRDREVNNIDEK